MSGRGLGGWTLMGIPCQTIKAVQERSGGVCELCHSRPATQVHHAKTKGMGGSTRVYTAEMLEDLCLKCHAAGHGYTVLLENDY